MQEQPGQSVRLEPISEIQETPTPASHEGDYRPTVDALLSIAAPLVVIWLVGSHYKRLTRVNSDG